MAKLVCYFYTLFNLKSLKAIQTSLRNISYFSKSNIRAINRIGPHDKEVLEQIVCGLLGDCWFDRIPTKKGLSYRFNIDQESNNNEEYIRWLTQWFYDRGYCPSPNPKVIYRDKCIIYRLSLFTFTYLGWIYNDFYKIDPITKKNSFLGS